MIARVAMASLAVVGCGAHASPPRCAPCASPRHATPSSAPSTDVDSPPPLLAQRVEAVVRGAAPAGARFARYVASGFLTERQSVTHGIDVPAGACVSLVAFTSPAISDLDARVYDADGELLVEDVEPDAHPTVQLCADQERRVFHVAQAFEGEGAYVLAMFTGDRRAMDAIARIVGGRPGTAVSTRERSSDAERRLSELRASLARRGFAPTADALRVAFSAGGSASVPVSVSVDRCYTFAAIADGDSAALDLRVYDADGELLAYDVRPERDASVQLCPNVSGPLRLDLRTTQPGAALVLSLAADASSFGGSNTLWLGERAASTVSPAPIEQRIASARARLSALGYQTIASSNPVVFVMSESRESPIPLEPNRCTALASIAGRGVGRITLAAFDDGGELLARGAAADDAVIAVLCPPSRERVLARQRVEVGGGEVALLTAAGPAPPAWSVGLERQVVSEALAQQLAHSAPWRSIAAPERIRLGGGAARAREFDVSAGSCTRAVVSARAAQGLALTLRSGAGIELARSFGIGSVRLTHCVLLPTRVRLEVELDEPSASEREAVFQRFERPDHERIAEVATP